LNRSDATKQLDLRQSRRKKSDNLTAAGANYTDAECGARQNIRTSPSGRDNTLCLMGASVNQIERRLQRTPKHTQLAYRLAIYTLPWGGEREEGRVLLRPPARHPAGGRGWYEEGGGDPPPPPRTLAWWGCAVDDDRRECMMAGGDGGGRHR